MTAVDELLIRNADLAGYGLADVRIQDGVVIAIGQGLRSSRNDIDAGGGALIPGLTDHHIHLFATAASRQTLRLESVKSRGALEQILRKAIHELLPDQWLRAAGYDERIAGTDFRPMLDALSPDHPVRIQARTGGLWILNSIALMRLGNGPYPGGVETGPDGLPSGRIWREDAWLRQILGGEMPDLAPVGAQLAAYGITSVTDASVTTDQGTADLLAAAHRTGAIPQRLELMSGGELAGPSDGAFTVGAVKIVLDDGDLPDLGHLCDMIRAARKQDRAVAFHCVATAELAILLAALMETGSRLGDRIEHGGIIPVSAIGGIQRLGLAVVTQPGFIHARGGRYLDTVDPGDLPDLYRCASLLQRGVPVFGSSDAPYGPLDPWLAMKAAIERRSEEGLCLGESERLAPAEALALYSPGYRKPLQPGSKADLCLLKTPLDSALQQLSAGLVRMTIIGGRLFPADGQPANHPAAIESCGCKPEVGARR